MTCFVLDTDHLSILQRKSEPAFSKLTQRLAAHSPDLIFVTIVSFQEQFQGWLAFINRSKSMHQVVTAYAKLESLIRLFSVSQILSFDEKAAEIAKRLRKRKTRLGTMDLRIASIVLAHNAVLLTRNIHDFNKVPNLKVQDWTV